MHFAFVFFMFVSSSRPIGTMQPCHPSTGSQTRAFDVGVGSSAENAPTEAQVKLTWEPDFAAEIIEKLSEPMAYSDTPFMIAVVGIPGSGKTTSSTILTELLSSIGSALMPFDGYHYPISALKKFPNPEDVIYRRGASDTFDVDSLKNDLRSIRYGESKMVKVPGFDHAIGDPEPDAHVFDREKHRVVIVEGLYLLHNDAGWEEVADFFDYKIYVDADIDMCMERLKIRNACIPGYTPEEISIRCDAVDRVNAMTVEKSKRRADRVVKSAACTQ
jgi:pantothenate kinase